MRVCTLVIVVGLLVVGAIGARAGTLYDHGGSVMRLTVSGSDVLIVFETPREGLMSQGVEAGTLFFDGRLDDALNLTGMARIFSARCGETAYPVEGAFVPQASFTLSGVAPLRSGGDCQLSQQSMAASLRFNFLGVDAVPPPSPAPQPAPAPQPVPMPQPAPPVEGPVAGEAILGPFCLAGAEPAPLRAGPGEVFSIVGYLQSGSCDLMAFTSCVKDWCLLERGALLGWVPQHRLHLR